MTNEPLEKTITAQIIRYIEKLGPAHAHKVHGGAYGASGEPDVDACIKGRCVKLEVKRPSQRNHTTPRQRLALTRWQMAGAVVGVVCSVGDAEALFLDAGLIDPVP